MELYNLNQSKFKIIAEPSLVQIEDKKIKDSKDCNKILRLCYEITNNHISTVESFFALYLNRQNEIIAFQHVSVGGVSGTVVDPKVIFNHAINVLASGIILCHNHPSGNLKPSEQDMIITKQLQDGAKLFDMHIIDHIIITEKSYYSFADEGLLHK